MSLKLKRHIYFVTAVVSLLIVSFLNVSNFVNFGPELRRVQFALWSIHTPWFFFTESAISSQKPFAFKEHCVFSPCDQVLHEYRWRARIVQSNIEMKNKIQFVESKGCQYTTLNEIVIISNDESRSIPCKR